MSWERLQDEVINAGICTHCGTCVGLSSGTLTWQETAQGPLPTPVNNQTVQLLSFTWDACPGKGINYPQATQHQFGRLPQNSSEWLAGISQQAYIGYASQENIRRQGASGGVIIQTLIYLLESGQVDGVVTLCQGQPTPWQAEPIIVTTPEALLAAAQSVYVPAPVNTILDQMTAFAGRLAYVGLPDQVASLRQLQQAGHAGANKVDYVLGPYVGTAMYFGAIHSFLRANGVKDHRQITRLRYRDGEWPGSLHITLQDGRVLTAEKFYYNYLIPFYITQRDLQAMDFANELTDISVGDAWHPQFEAKGEGFSVLLGRSKKAVDLLGEMENAGILHLTPIPIGEALAMHGHMLDFKKRGSYLRNQWRKKRGKAAPNYGYAPRHMPLSRKLVELFIVMLFGIAGTRLARKIVEYIPLNIIGPAFNTLRKAWKDFSKPVKRKGLGNIEFELQPPPPPVETGG